MNTRQLIALWYAAILLAACAVAAGFVSQRNWYDFGPHAFFGMAGGIVILSATLIYTLSEHPNAQPKQLWKIVGLPAGIASLIAIGILLRHAINQSGLYSVEDSAQELPAGELAKLQASATLDDYGKLTCNIYNGSSWDVKDIIIHVDVAPRPLTDADFLEKYGVKEPTPDQKNPFMDASPVPMGQQNPFMDASPSPTPSPAAAPTPSTQAPSASRIIQVPDGTVEFPAGMTDEQIEAVLQKEYPPTKKTPAITFDDVPMATAAHAKAASPGTQTGHIVYDTPPPPISRDLRLTSDYSFGLSPLKAADFIALTGIKNRSHSKWVWKIVSARGYPDETK